MVRCGFNSGTGFLSGPITSTCDELRQKPGKVVIPRSRPIVASDGFNIYSIGGTNEDGTLSDEVSHANLGECDWGARGDINSTNVGYVSPVSGRNGTSYVHNNTNPNRNYTVKGFTLDLRSLPPEVFSKPYWPVLRNDLITPPCFPISPQKRIEEDSKCKKRKE